MVTQWTCFCHTLTNAFSAAPPPLPSRIFGPNIFNHVYFYFTLESKHLIFTFLMSTDRRCNFTFFFYSLCYTWTKRKDCWFVVLRGRIQELRDQSIGKHRMMMNEFSQCIEFAFSRYKHLSAEKIIKIS